MRLSGDEKQISEYYFGKSEKNPDNMSILTDKRIIVSYRNGEESYPLSKVTGVKYFEYSHWWKLIIGIVALLPAVLILVDIVQSLFWAVSGQSSGYGDAGSSGIGVIILIIIMFLILAILGFLLIKSGLKKRTKLVIDQMGGKKKYSVVKNESLINFIEEINQRLK